MSLEIRRSLENLDRLTISGANKKLEFDLYDETTLEVLATLWEKAAYHHRLTHVLSWMGVPIIQFAEDIVMMQELLWNLRPDVVIECGVAHGGSTIMYAAMMELIGKGRIIGVDVEIRPHTHKNIAEHAVSHRINLLKGNSIDSAVVAKVEKFIKPEDSVIVVLDSNHRRAHVSAELQTYKRLVTAGSYLVVMDTNSSYVHDVPSGNRAMLGDSALEAVEEFLANQTEFSVDAYYNRLHITANSCGFLRKNGGGK